MTVALNERWHELLNDEIAQSTHAHIESELVRRELVFGGRALCTVLRPRLVTLDELTALARRVRPLMSAFRAAHARGLIDTEFRAQFRLADWEEVVLSDPQRYTFPSPTSRPDYFYVPETGELALTEYNAESPAGAAYNDALSDAFIDSDVMRLFSREYEILTVPSRHGVVGSVLNAWQEFSRSRRAPRVAILDWDEVPTRTEFELFRQHFETMGLACVIEDPRRCEYRGGVLYAQGQPVDLIYKRVLITELVDTCGLEHDVVRAVRDGAVCMVNGFHCKMLHKKASLAVLSDPENAEVFSSREQRAIHDSIPWTRVVEERKTRYGNADVDLLPFIVENKDSLVLKPNDDYGGAGITLGWDATSEEWAAAVQLATQTPYIVQEKVTIPSEPFPSLVDGSLVIANRMLDTAPFVTNGDYMEGLLTRLSTAKLLNVTAGGGSTIPTFVVHPRD
jgi:uncharacterized circularly permuted ATP-grasp superfamily protein